MKNYVIKPEFGKIITVTQNVRGRYATLDITTFENNVDKKYSFPTSVIVGASKAITAYLDELYAESPITTSLLVFTGDLMGERFEIVPQIRNDVRQLCSMLFYTHGRHELNNIELGLYSRESIIEFLEIWNNTVEKSNLEKIGWVEDCATLVRSFQV